jgi:hypothetical protein
MLPCTTLLYCTTSGNPHQPRMHSGEERSRRRRPTATPAIVGESGHNAPGRSVAALRGSGAQVRGSKDRAGQTACRTAQARLQFLGRTQQAAIYVTSCAIIGGSVRNIICSTSPMSPLGAVPVDCGAKACYTGVQISLATSPADRNYS